MPVPPPPPQITPQTPTLDKWNVQVGEYGSRKVAEEKVRQAIEDLGRSTARGSYRGLVLTVRKGDQNSYLAVVGGFPSNKDADFACKVLQELGAEAQVADGTVLQQRIEALK